MATATHMYLLLVVTKAGAFFPKGSDQYKKYAQLMFKNFKVDILDKSFQTNTFILKTGQDLHDKIQSSHDRFVPYAKGYGVEPSHEDMFI